MEYIERVIENAKNREESESKERATEPVNQAEQASEPTKQAEQASEPTKQTEQASEPTKQAEQALESTKQTEQSQEQKKKTEQFSKFPGESQKKKHSADDALEALMAQAKTRVKIIGCGGAGNNTLTRISEIKVAGTRTIAINTDAQDLLYTISDEKILIGKDLTKGLGAGSAPKIGEEAARESERDIRDAVSNADMIFVTCGLGGGTGTGSAPIIAEAAKKSGALTVGIVTLPFTMEGQRRIENAIYGLEKLEKNVDTLIIISNDRLLDLAPELPLHTAFKVADEILANSVKGITELITKPGLVNLDFADVKAVMSNGGLALIGIGESESENRAVDSVEKAVSNPLLDVDITGATGALVNIIGGNDMTLDDSRRVIEAVSKKIDRNAKMIWGAQIDESLRKTIRTLIIITGVKSSEIWASGKKSAEKRKRDMAQELGIDYVPAE